MPKTSSYLNEHPDTQKITCISVRSAPLTVGPVCWPLAVWQYNVYEWGGDVSTVGDSKQLTARLQLSANPWAVILPAAPLPPAQQLLPPSPHYSCRVSLADGGKGLGAGMGG